MVLNRVKQLFRAKPKPQRPVLDAENTRPLMAARPMTLEQRYSVNPDPNVCEDSFMQLKNSVFQALDRTRQDKKVAGRIIGPKFIRESGRLEDYKPYFFIQPLNEQGLLFERTGDGWLITKAQKIVSSSSFLRAYEPWDRVTLHQAADGSQHVRVSSERFNLSYVSLLVYQDLLCDHMVSQ